MLVRLCVHMHPETCLHNQCSVQFTFPMQIFYARVSIVLSVCTYETFYFLEAFSFKQTKSFSLLDKMKRSLEIYFQHFIYESNNSSFTQWTEYLVYLFLGNKTLSFEKGGLISKPFA